MAKIQKKSKQQFHLIPFFYFPPKDCPSGGGGSYPHSALPLARARTAPTEQTIFSHRFSQKSLGGAAVPAAPTKQTCTNITTLPQIAKNFWRKIFSHRLHRCAQIRRVWHPCHTHAATKLSSHRIHGTHRNDWRRRKICVHL